MTTLDIIKSYSQALDKMGNLNKYYAQLKNFSDLVYKEQNNIIKALLVNSLNVSQVNTSLVNSRDSIVKTMEELINAFNFMEAHETSIHTSKEITEILENCNSKIFKENILDVLKAFDVTLKFLIQFMSSRNVGHIPSFIEGYKSFSLKYNIFLNNFSAFDELLLLSQSNFTEENNKCSFSLNFYDENMSFKDFILKLLAIYSFYDVICQLSNETYDENNLQISKIETGSFFAKLFGLEKVIEGMMMLFNRFVDLAFKRLTREGKLETLNQEFETILKSAEVQEKLNSLGIKTDTSDPIIADSYNKVLHSLNVLVNGQKKLKINDELYETSTPVKINMKDTLLTNNLNNSDTQESENE